MAASDVVLTLRTGETERVRFSPELHEVSGEPGVEERPEMLLLP